MKRIKHLLFVLVLCFTFIGFLTTLIKAPTKVEAASIPSGQTLDENKDVVSVRDLTFNGLTGQSAIHKNANTDATFTFSGENTNKSIVFKFKYDVVDTTATDSNAVNIYMGVQSTNKWDTTRSLWIRGDGTHIARYQDSSFGYKKLDAFTAGLHDVEYGRVALLEGGNPTGNYYSYFKLDGVEIRSDINPYDVATIEARFFFNYSAGNTKNTIYDAFYTYEKPQYVSISDFRSGGNPVGDKVANKGGTIYTYDTTNQPTNKSVLLCTM